MEGDAMRIGLAAAAPVVRAGCAGLGKYRRAVVDDVVECGLDRLGFGIRPVGLNYESLPSSPVPLELSTDNSHSTFSGEGA